GAPELDLADELAERMHNGRKREFTVHLVELPADESAALAGERFVDLVHQRRLAGAGIAGDEHQLGRAPTSALECGEQRRDLLLPAVELLGDAQVRAPVREAECKRRDPPPRFGPLSQAGFEVDPEPASALVALLWRLGQK